MSLSSAARPHALSLAIALLAALMTASGLGYSARHPPELRSVEALEANAQIQAPTGRVDLGAPPADLAAAGAFCGGSLVRHLSHLEQDAPEKARRYGLAPAQLRFGAMEAQSGLATAQMTLILEGPQEGLGRALAQSSIWLPSFFFDAVRVTPIEDGRKARLEAQGRVVCRAA